MSDIANVARGLTSKETKARAKELDAQARMAFYTALPDIEKGQPITLDRAMKMARYSYVDLLPIDEQRTRWSQQTIPPANRKLLRIGNRLTRACTALCRRPSIAEQTIRRKIGHDARRQLRAGCQQLNSAEGAAIASMKSLLNKQAALEWLACPDGIPIDILVRPMGSLDDRWMAVQVKSALPRRNGVTVFLNGGETVGKYHNQYVVCMAISDLMRVIPNDPDQHDTCTLNSITWLGINNAKYIKGFSVCGNTTRANSITATDCAGFDRFVAHFMKSVYEVTRVPNHCAYIDRRTAFYLSPTLYSTIKIEKIGLCALENGIGHALIYPLRQNEACDFSLFGIYFSAKTAVISRAGFRFVRGNPPNKHLVDYFVIMIRADCIDRETFTHVAIVPAAVIFMRNQITFGWSAKNPCPEMRTFALTDPTLRDVFMSLRRE